MVEQDVLAPAEEGDVEAGYVELLKASRRKIYSLQAQLKYSRDSLEILRDELYSYWHKELVEQGVDDPLDRLPRMLVDLLREKDRLYGDIR